MDLAVRLTLVAYFKPHNQDQKNSVEVRKSLKRDGNQPLVRKQNEIDQLLKSTWSIAVIFIRFC